MSYNFASPLAFSFQCDKTPLMNPTIQQLSIPFIHLGGANIPNAFVKISQPGNIEYGSLTINFKILEDYSNYLEIVDWLYQLGHPSDLSQFQDKRIDATILPQTSNKQTALVITLEDIQPSHLSIPQFDTTLTTMDYLNATVTFDFTALKFKRANESGC